MMLQGTVQTEVVKRVPHFDVNFNFGAFLNIWHKNKTGWLEGP